MQLLHHFPGFLPFKHAPETLKLCVRGYPNQSPEPPQLASFNPREQQLYPNLRADGQAPHLISEVELSLRDRDRKLDTEKGKSFQCLPSTIHFS